PEPADVVERDPVRPARGKACKTPCLPLLVDADHTRGAVRLEGVSGILAERTAQPGDPLACRHCDVRLGPQSGGVATASARERHWLAGHAEQEQPAGGRDCELPIASRAGEV